MMDSHELAQRAQKLPDTFASRLTADDYEDVHDALRAGEWEVGLNNLIAALNQTAIPITTREHDELTALCEAINLPASSLTALTIQD